MKALILSADNFEDSELLVPFYRMQEAGFTVEVAGAELGNITGKHGYEVQVNKTFADIRPEDYAVLILPGGKAPAAIRDLPEVQAIVRAFFAAYKTVGAICHGPQILASADVLSGRHVTCYQGVAEEIQKAGAKYQNSEVVVDSRLVTSRQPADLPAFMRELMRLLPH